MRSSFLRHGSVIVSLLLAACASGCAPHDEAGTASDDIRTITTAEALDDFDQIASAFRTLYGAMDRKQAKYGFDFETMVTDYRGRVSAARTEGEVAGLFIEFVSQFKDPHVYLDRQLVNDASQGHWLPFAVDPVESTYLVSWIDSSAPAGTFKMGDELLAIDGVSATDLAAMFSKYFAVANPLASKSITASYLTGRASFLPGMVSDATPAKIRFRGADGVERTVSIPWNKTAHPLAKVLPVPEAGGSVTREAMGVSRVALDAIAANGSDDEKAPFFLTEASKQVFEGFTPAKPSSESLAKMKLEQATADQIGYFAGTYTTGGKKVLFFRLPDYSPDDPDAAGAYIKALFDTYQPQVDALVFDETHNPGGSIYFAQLIASLLAKGPYNDYVEQLHADRKWMKSLSDLSTRLTDRGSTDLATIFLDQARAVESAYDSGKTLSSPVPFVTGAAAGVADPSAWTKPSMMLVDELSVSCADFVPLIVKTNHMATLFGQTTMGGGGNVEKVATLNNTQMALSLSRGLATVFDPTGVYPEANEIEDNGVTPDIFYTHTVADVRAGYVDYVKAINTAVLDVIKASAPTPP